MKGIFTSYEISLELKKKGFNLPCIAEWDTTDQTIHLIEGFESPSQRLENDWQLCAPTWGQALKWLREKHGIHVQPQKSFHNKTYLLGKILLEIRLEGDEFKKFWGSPGSYSKPTSKKFNTYEEALEYGLLQALKLIS